MARSHNAPSAFQPLASEKENRPAKKAKQTISVSTLFYHKKRTRQPDAKSDRTRTPTSPRILQSRGPQASTMQSRRAARHPLYRNFTDAAGEYRKGVVTSHKTEQLEPIYDQLLARVDAGGIGKCSQDQSVEISTAELESLLREPSKSSKSFDEETILQCISKDSNTRTREVKFSETVQAFEGLLNRKRAQLEDLFEQLQHINVEIVKAQSDLLESEWNDVKEANSNLDESLLKLAEEAQRVKERTMADVGEARKDDQAVSAATRRKMEDALRILS